VNQDAATAWLRERGARWFYVVAPDLNLDRNNAQRENESGMKYRARMQFYGGEDPATGSAAGCAISYLVARGAVSSGVRVHLRQGVEIGRPSDLFLSAKMVGTKDGARFASGVTDVRVAGSTVLVAKGQLFLP
jgi:trans-2,3-dihydro-3-hydroxyanthranilate isomerase